MDRAKNRWLRLSCHFLEPAFQSFRKAKPMISGTENL